MSTQGHESEAINVSGLKASLKKGGNIGIYNEAICSTAGGTAAKVTNTTPPSFTLTAGAKILVKFTYAISAENATLQVGSNSAKPIYYKGSALPADLVKAGTSLLLSYDGTSFNIVGDINTDTTYSVMGASGSTHASGLVPDTPSTAGITKFLREDGTWQEPAGQNYSAGDGIDITNGEISVDSTVALKTDLAPAKLGSGIGTCSTSSGTALEVVLSDYNLVQNGIVAVTFSYDVPANATLNVNGKGAKPIYYKGSAITADTIKADDTVMFAYDGTSYVVTSLGGGGGTIVWPEFVTIHLTSNLGDSDSNLNGATIVVTDDDNQETILSTTWSGTDIVVHIDAGVTYTVTVGAVSGYYVVNQKTYTSIGEGYSRTVSFLYMNDVVDLGLPSGTLWCSHNVGTVDPTAAGLFFSFGNIVGHNLNKPATADYSFTTQNYASTPGGQLSTAYVSGDPTYDAARAIMGGEWRTPTHVEFDELFANTVMTEETGAFKLTSKVDNTKYIIFPKTGNYNGTSIETADRPLFNLSEFGFAQMYSSSPSPGYMTRYGASYSAGAFSGRTVRAVI